MKQQRDGAGPSTSDFRNSRYDGPVRAKLGATLRERHDLKEPLAPRLLELLAQLGTTVRETEEAKLYAEVDECVAAMVCAANRKPREPGEAQRPGTQPAEAGGQVATPPACVQFCTDFVGGTDRE
jgi:hypothetical protein